MTTDVLIVGAGPTGLMMAALLARRGVRSVIIDRHAGPAIESRALGVQARTLEIYRILGIADEAIARGRRATGASMWAEGRLAAHVPLGDAGRDLSPYPFLLILGQDANEQLLGSVLARHGGAVRWNHELVGLAEDATGVTASIRTADGVIQEIRAAWVAGCDGARSAVRTLNDIPFVGAPYEQVFFVADVRVTGPMVPEELNVFLWRNGFHLFFPMRGQDHWRIAGILPPALRDQDGVRFDDVVPSILAETGPTLAFAVCDWFSTYRIHHRRAQRFRHGRCFLLGDAAHIHSPVGAQGMNTGLQDAWNLAWKLALVVQGRAGEGLLESYEAERIPVAERLLRTTDRAFAAVVSGSELVAVIRNRIMPRLLSAAMHQERVQRFAFRTISQTGISYRSSPLSANAGGLPEGAPKAGERFPWIRLRLAGGPGVEDLLARLDDLHFHLVLVGQPAPAAVPAVLGDMLALHVVAEDPANQEELARANMPGRAFYLVRPDGYVGLCGSDFREDLLLQYCRERRLGQ